MQRLFVIKFYCFAVIKVYRDFFLNCLKENILKSKKSQKNVKKTELVNFKLQNIFDTEYNEKKMILHNVHNDFD